MWDVRALLYHSLSMWRALIRRLGTHVTWLVLLQCWVLTEWLVRQYCPFESREKWGLVWYQDARSSRTVCHILSILENGRINPHPPFPVQISHISMRCRISQWSAVWLFSLLYVSPTWAWCLCNLKLALLWLDRLYIVLPLAFKYEKKSLLLTRNDIRWQIIYLLFNGWIDACPIPWRVAESFSPPDKYCVTAGYTLLSISFSGVSPLLLQLQNYLQNRVLLC